MESSTPAFWAISVRSMIWLLSMNCSRCAEWLVKTSGALPAASCVVSVSQYCPHAVWVIFTVMPGLAAWKSSAHCW